MQVDDTVIAQYRYKSILSCLHVDKSERARAWHTFNVQSSEMLFILAGLSFCMGAKHSIFRSINSFSMSLFLLHDANAPRLAPRYWLKHFVLCFFSFDETIQNSEMITMKNGPSKKEMQKKKHDGKKWMRSRQRPNAE